MKKAVARLLIALCLPILIFSQEKPKDKGLFVEPKPGFWDEIQKTTKEFGQTAPPVRKFFAVDLTGFDSPQSLEGFPLAWHNPPTSQGNTNTCWCFSTTSFFET